MLRIKEAFTTVSRKVAKQTASKKGGACNVKFHRLCNDSAEMSESGPQDKPKKRKSVMPLTISFDDLDGVDRSPGDVLRPTRKSSQFGKSNPSEAENTKTSDDSSEPNEVVLFVSSTRSRPTPSLSFGHQDDDDDVSF